MTPPSRSLVIGLLLFCTFLSASLLSGCKKPAASGGSGAGEIALSRADLNDDGTITPDGMQNIESEAGHATLDVNFIRTQLTDAGLQQLGKFKNLRHVQAFGSRVTPGGIERLKKAVPGVEVVR